MSVNEDDETGITNEYDGLKSQFQLLTEKTFHDLMHSEIKLFECIEVANVDFKQVIDALLNEFIEHAQGIFVQMRNSEINFSGAMYETVARYITMKAVVAEEATVAEELQEVSYVFSIAWISFCFICSSRSVSKINPTSANSFWVAVNTTSWLLIREKKD